MQFNIHELQTILHHKLPIKIFVFNNSGYLAIRHTQDGFFEGRYIGSDAKGGVSLPDFQKISRAYGIKAIRINNHRELLKKIRVTLKERGPVLCEIMISKDQQLIPRMGFYKKEDGSYAARSLEDMEPLLAREEFMSNMIASIDIRK
jgi:acetolactate synthase-1/2/3 large subunit